MKFLIAILTVATITPATAFDYTSIEKFNTWCASENTVLRDRCAAFVMHVTHGLKVDQAMDRMSVTCVPDDIDRNDIIDKVTRILALAAKADPRTKGAPANVAIFQILQRAYPCEDRGIKNPAPLSSLGIDK
jgi:hypothetical protein